VRGYEWTSPGHVVDNTHSDLRARILVGLPHDVYANGVERSPGQDVAPYGIDVCDPAAGRAVDDGVSGSFSRVRSGTIPLPRAQAEFNDAKQNQHESPRGNGKLHHSGAGIVPPKERTRFATWTSFLDAQRVQASVQLTRQPRPWLTALPERDQELD
jgi:hypothetical protein